MLSLRLYAYFKHILLINIYIKYVICILIDDNIVWNFFFFLYFVFRRLCFYLLFIMIFKLI